MSSSQESLIRTVRQYQSSLDKYTEKRNDDKLLHYLGKLYQLPVKVVHLEETGVGRTVNSLRKIGGEVGYSAKKLVSKWKEMVVGEQEQEEEEEDDDEDDDEEDGYQSGGDISSESEKSVKEKNRAESSSSHNRSEKRNEDKEKRRSSSGKNDDNDSSSSKKNGHSKHRTQKRKTDSESEEVETPRKKVKTEGKRRPKRMLDSDSEDERKKQKTQENKSAKSKHKESGDKDRNKEKQKATSDTSKRHDSEKKAKDKDKDKEKKQSDDKKEKKQKTNLPNDGINSGSGASFAEALGMCDPSSSNKTAKKKEKSAGEKKEKPKTDDSVPKLLKEVSLDPPGDLNLSSLLPPITPNYRPLGNFPNDHHKKSVSDYEALSSIMTSKNQRTKVYSGNKMGTGKVATLFELCSRVLQDNIDALEYTGGVPYSVLKPILEKSTPNQLYTMEHHNPYLIEDTDELWQIHCQKEFRNKKREELETWREMYLRCLDERDAKLKALTANIKQSQDKSIPVRMTKLAYVETVAKPPRNIARKQAKNGTAFEKKPSMTPAARLSSLATAGEAGKVAVPNPGSRAVERSSTHNVKPKKAPLMLKSISSFKNRFKR